MRPDPDKVQAHSPVARAAAAAESRILNRARVFVEFEPQTRIEGEIQQMPADFPVVDLWKVLAGTAEGRQSPEQVTVFDSVGFALEDYSTLRYAYTQARQRNVGVDIELVPDGDDPKDLYRFVRGKSSRGRLRRVA